MGVRGKGQRGNNLALGLGSSGCDREGAGVRWWTFRALFIAGKTQAWLLLQRRHPEGDLWSREKGAIRGLLVELVRSSVWKDSQGIPVKEPAPHTDMHSYWNTPREARFHCFSFPSLTSFLPFPFLFTIPKVNTLSAQTAALTQQVRLGLTAIHVFKAPPDEVWRTSSPARRLTPRGVSGWCMKQCVSCPAAANERWMEETDVENPPPPCSLSLRSCKKQIWALFSCGGNDCLVLLMEKGCWFWQWGYHVAMQTRKAGWK